MKLKCQNFKQKKEEGEKQDINAGAVSFKKEENYCVPTSFFWVKFFFLILLHEPKKQCLLRARIFFLIAFF